VCRTLCELSDYRVETVPVFSAIGEMKIGLINQATPTVTATDRAKMAMPHQSLASRAVNMMFMLCNTPVVNTRNKCTMMNTMKYIMVKKWILRATGSVKALFNRSAFCGHQVDNRSPVTTAIGAAMNTVMKYVMICKAL